MKFWNPRPEFHKSTYVLLDSQNLEIDSPTPTSYQKRSWQKQT